MGYESARALAWEYANFPNDISKTLKPRLDKGWTVTREDYDAIREIVRRCRRALAERMPEVDFLLTPSAPSEAPASLANTGNSVFNRAWTALGVPCVSVPRGKGPAGLPLAIQLVGPMHGDTALLAWADWVAQRA